MKLPFPGRRIAHTTFQENYLAQVFATLLDKIEFATHPLKESAQASDHFITSSNQENSCYSLVSFHVCFSGTRDFVRPFEWPPITIVWAGEKG